MASHGAYSNLGTQLGHPEQEILDWLAGEVNQQPFSWIQCTDYVYATDTRLHTVLWCKVSFKVSCYLCTLHTERVM